jgi:hypothetical protein
MTFSLSNLSGNTPPGQYITTNSTGQYVTVGSDKKLFVSSDYGVSFTVVTVTGNIYCVAMSSSGQYQYACSTGVPASNIYVSNNSGLSWTLAQSVSGNNAGRWSRGIACDATGQYVITASGGNAGYNFPYYSKTFGVSWLYVPSAVVENRCSCTISNTLIGYATTNSQNRKIFSYNLSLTTVSEVASFISIAGVSQTKWITTNTSGNKLFCTTLANQGLYSSTGVPSGVVSVLTLPATFVSVWYNSAGTHLWAASSTTIYYSINNGTSWSSIATGFTNIYGVNISSNGSRLYLLINTGTITDAVVYVDISTY